MNGRFTIGCLYLVHVCTLDTRYIVTFPGLLAYIFLELRIMQLRLRVYMVNVCNMLIQFKPFRIDKTESL